MQRTAAKRIAQYDAKYDPTSWALKVAAAQPGAVADFAGFVNSWIPFRDATVVVLNENGIFPLFVGQFLAYSSRIWRLMQLYTGNSEGLQVAVALLIAQWAARGLGTAVLTKVRDEVYGISAPAGP